MVGRIPILDVTPVVDLGRRPAKAIVGEPFPVSATVFREGHDTARRRRRAARPRRARRRPPVRMRRAPRAPTATTAWVTPDAEGAGPSRSRRGATRSRTWQHDAGIKIPAGVDVELMLDEGALLLERVRRRPGRRRATGEVARGRRSPRPRDAEPAGRGPAGRRCSPPSSTRLLAAHPLRELRHRRGPATRCASTASARCSAAGTSSSRAPRAPTVDAEDRQGRQRHLPDRREAARRRSPTMGFDVVYLPPIHPIGEVNRKGPNNTLTPGPDDPGSPWAIGVRGRRPRRDPPRPRHDRGLRRLRGAGPASSAWRSRSTSRCRPRPTTRG